MTRRDIHNKDNNVRNIDIQITLPIFPFLVIPGSPLTDFMETDSFPSEGLWESETKTSPCPFVSLNTESVYSKEKTTLCMVICNISIDIYDL